MAVTATQVTFDTPAAEFRLPATDGKTYALDDLVGARGTVVAFICNHCPYVKAVIDRMVADARVLMSEGIGFVAICSNDEASYPEDSFENMKHFAKAHDFPFPYLHDETQAVARAYGAVCTPDFFGYGAERKLKYRGRLDEGRKTPPRPGAPRELVEAMRAIAKTGVAPVDQNPSLGCSIKWKDDA
jgi:peroxiredoxin